MRRKLCQSSSCHNERQIQRAQCAAHAAQQDAVDKRVQVLAAHDFQPGIGRHKDEIRAFCFQFTRIACHAADENVHRRAVARKHHQHRRNDDVLHMVNAQRNEEVHFQDRNHAQHRQQRRAGAAELILEQLPHAFLPPFRRKSTDTGSSASHAFLPAPRGRRCAPRRRSS